MPNSILEKTTANETTVPTFGVRHLSPMGAWQLRRFLDEKRPKVVLIEGLDDATPLIRDITRKGSEPPIAILAYSDSLPVRTLVYPMATYSPEYQAVLWAKENKAKAEYFDLPSDVFLALQAKEEERRLATYKQRVDDEQNAQHNQPDNIEVDSTSSTAPKPTQPDVGSPESSSLYSQLATLADEQDYESYWERNFEHNESANAYRLSTYEFGNGIRQSGNTKAEDAFSSAENIVRESYMRRRIQETINSGFDADEVVAVVGAFHAPVLTNDCPIMSDEEFESLARLPSKLTLMPYSYFKLSSQSGYGAGNAAPAYFELLWEAISEGELPLLAARYLSLVVRHLRESGTHRSTAEVIEGVRLARTLSAMKNGLAPTLRDLQDAAITLIGHGERSVVQQSLAKIEIGTAIGKLPKGVSQTSIQEDFKQNLIQLKLVKYREGVKKEVDLDLRENRRAKSEDAAFLDLNRSSFLHRLELLEVPFAKRVPVQQDSATWAEKWHLHWTPEAEIALVEAVLLGETLELATGFRFKTQLQDCHTINDAAMMVRRACECGLMDSMEAARDRLQHLAAETSEFTAVANAVFDLSTVVRYGDVRQFDPQPLVPLIQDLFIQGTLGLFAAANCDSIAAVELVDAVDLLNKVGLDYYERVDESAWLRELHQLSNADDRNPLAAGYACAILLERNEMSNEQLAVEVSRRLSPGIEADLGAGWFEGLSRRNRYALLARQILWEQLSDYVSSLDDEQFRRALVFLRRAFGHFSPQEKRSIAENLGESWGLNADAVSELMSQPLSEEEEQSLNEFDFDDL